MTKCEIFGYDENGESVVDETLTLHDDNRVTSDRGPGEPTMLTWSMYTFPQRKIWVQDDPTLWFFSIPLEFVNSTYISANFVWEPDTDIANVLKDIGWPQRYIELATKNPKFIHTEHS